MKKLHISERPDVGEKRCGKCQKDFPRTTDFFDKDSSKHGGFRNWCKKCRKEKQEFMQAHAAAELLKKLDLTVISNLADSKPGGSNIPHAAEIYQNVMALMGGAQGFAMHWAGTFIASQPGSQTRERMLAGMQKLSQAVSDSNKVQMPSELMSDADLQAEIERREQQMKVVDATVTDATVTPPADEPELNEPTAEQSAPDHCE